MATSEITQSIKDITGISSVSTHSIQDAQRFAVASIPKNLLRFAMYESSPSTDGSAIAHEVNDSIIDVQRNGFSCNEIPFSESIWANNSISLKKATASFPVYWTQAEGIKIAPVTDGSNSGYVYWINSAELDDDCDLRNAIVYRACSAEFEKLASSKIIDWTDLVVPIPPVSPNFGSDLTISVTPPVAPTLSSSTVSFSQAVPTYTKPISSLTTFPTLDWTMPTSPIAPTTSVQTVDDFTGQNPTYTPPVVSLTTAPTISDLSITAVAPAVPSFTAVSFTSVDGSFDTVQPIVTTTSIAASSIYTGTAPTFTPPVMGALDFTTFETHLDTNEDTELASGKIQQIQAQIGEFSAKLPEAQANYEVENVAYQSAIQESVQNMQAANQVAITNAQTELDNAKSNKDRDIQRQLQNGINDMQAIVQENQRKLALYQAEQGQYSADVQKEVQNYQQTLQKELQIWQGERTAELQKFGSDMTNALNTFNKENAIYQGTIQGFVQEATLRDTEEARKLQIYASDIQVYQNSVAKVVQGNQGEFTAWQQENNMKTQKYASDIQNELNVFNKENAAYQGELQVSIQDAQLSSQDDAQKIQKYGAEVQTYQQDMNKEIQDFTNTLQKDSQEYQSKVALYTNDLQKYQAEIGEKTQKSASATQNAAYYSAEAKKYYEWALNEVNVYIQNNEKMINQTMAAKQQQAAQQQQRR